MASNLPLSGECMEHLHLLDGSWRKFSIFYILFMMCIMPKKYLTEKYHSLLAC